MVSALGELLKAHVCAFDAECDNWDFAVEIATLRRFGLMATDLRWLIRKSYVEHRRDTSGYDDDGRRFQTANPLKFQLESCFVLTSAGADFASRLLDGHDAGSTMLPTAFGQILVRVAPKPCWDAERRQLRVSEHVVKYFRWPAPNQERVLAAFEEDGWTTRIDDPLFPADGQEPKERLHDTIKCLNRRQKVRLIRFRGDGTGEGVVWLFEPKACDVLGIDLPAREAS